jgi:uncharacterized membrane protein YkvI
MFINFIQGADNMNESSNSTISLKTVCIVAGAFASYHIGSGFASGQEVMQFFGSWGGNWAYIVPLITAVFVVIFCTMLFSEGYTLQLEQPIDGYKWYCGKYIAKFMDVFTIVNFTGVVFIMFAGSGAAIHQYLGLPEYVGAILMGLIAVVVIWRGLERVTQVLGIAGILIIGFLLVFGLYIGITDGFDITVGQRNVLQYVADGRILQAGIGGIYNPIIAGLFYAGMIIFNSFPFIISIMPRIRNTQEATACGLCSAILLTSGVFIVLLIVLQNLDYIASTKAQIFTLAAIEKCLPVLAIPFVLVIIVGIFTTITGFLWVVARRFAPDKTKKQRSIVLGITLVGIFLGSVLPFDKLVNFLYPFTGIVGAILFVLVLFSVVSRKVQG